ncbi:hypothetical protein MNBD_GAMMA06-356 [hydrothermal vent metagenome]|uniref:Type IV pilin accessory protein n=1 Tax=hydrothermal vent metagenome TaxID=652676 RepID=A0A3B0W6V8_9ZZZZ
MSGDLIKVKLKAAGIHFGISIIIFLGVLYLILVEWYPGVFFEAEGGWNGIKLMAVVDLVLGPSLTLIIFNHLKAKKEIIFDLSLIAIVQISALVWGGLQVYSERPVALVLWEDKFYPVTEDYYKKQNIHLSDLAKYSSDKPLLIYAATNSDVKKLKELQHLNEKKIPPFAQVHLYQSLKDNLDKALRYQLPDEIKINYFSRISGIDKALVQQHAFLGKAKYRNFVVVIDNDANLVYIQNLE